MQVKERFILSFHRLAHHAGCWKLRNRALGILGYPVTALYKVLVEWVLGVELPAAVVPPEGLTLFHGVGLVVHPKTQLGKGVILRHNTTIGTKRLAEGVESDAPVLEEGVNVGPHAVIIGPIRLGKGAVIGAGAVVVKDVAPGTTVVGNPAHAIAGAPPAETNPS